MNTDINKSFWNKWGSKYSQVWESNAKKILSKKELECINKYLACYKPKQILDIGVGNGRIMENLLKNSSMETRIYGLDISENMIEICKKKFSDERKIKDIRRCNLAEEKMPFDFNFDFITAIRVLKYNKNWKQIIDKVMEKVNPGGIFIFTMPNNYSISGLKKDVFFDGKLPVYYTNINELKEQIKIANYKICDVIGFTKFPDFLYYLSNNKYYVSVLMKLEYFSELIFGKVFLSRYYFIIIQKYE